MTDSNATQLPAEQGGDGKTQTETQPAEQMVPKTEVEKLVSELKKYKTMAEDLGNKFKNQELEAAKAANDWQRVAEVKQKELEEMMSKFDGFKKAVVHDKRLTAIREEAIKSGLRKESLSDLGYLDYPEVKLQTDDEGNFKVEGADKAIQRLKTTRPHWFSSGVTNVNANTPTVTGGGSDKVSYETIKKLEAEYNKNPNPDNAGKLKGALIEFKRQSKG